MKHIFVFTLLCAALFFTGCSPKTGLSGLVPGKGTVTLDGAPVDGAAISFVPASSGVEVRSASAVSGSDGTFTLMTLQPEDGLFPGEYKVVVRKTEQIESTMTEDQRDAMRGAGQEPPPLSRDVLPVQYNSAETTPITVTIGAKGDSAIKIELKK